MRAIYSVEIHYLFAKLKKKHRDYDQMKNTHTHGHKVTAITPSDEIIRIVFWQRPCPKRKKKHETSRINRKIRCAVYFISFSRFCGRFIIIKQMTPRSQTNQILKRRRNDDDGRYFTRFFFPISCESSSWIFDFVCLFYLLFRCV